MRRHLCGRRRPGRDDPLERDLLTASARALRRRRTRDRLATPPGADRPRRRAFAGRGRHDDGRGGAGGRDAGPRPDRSAARRLLERQGTGGGPPSAVRRDRPSARPRVGQLPFVRGRRRGKSKRGRRKRSKRERWRGEWGRSVRATFPLPDRQRWPHAAGSRARARGLPDARPHARRRGRRGVRQGRKDAGPRLSWRPRAAAPGGRWRSAGVRVPDLRLARTRRTRRHARLRTQSRLLLRGPEDVAALQAARTGGRPASRTARPTSPPPTRPRSSST